MSYALRLASQLSLWLIALARFSRRLHYSSTEFVAGFQQPNRGIERCGTQLHLALRRGLDLCPVTL